MFEYVLRALIIGGRGVESFRYPTGDANNTNTSQFGFSFAADSIAQACLWVFVLIDMNVSEVRVFSVNN